MLASSTRDRLSIFFQIAAFAISVLIVLLLTRAIFDWVRSFARDWKPQGFTLVLANVAYSLTDPPINALRRVLPRFNFGGIALDLGFLVVLLGLIVVRTILLVFASAL